MQAHGGFDWIVDVVFQDNAGDRLIMALEAYFDESGTHNGPHSLIVAGYISTAEKWKRFRREWASFLATKCPGEAYFHSKDHIKDDLDPVSRRAVKIIRRNILYGFAVQVDEKAFMCRTTPLIRKKHGQSYDFCCQLILESLVLIPEVRALKGNIFYVFEQGAPHWEKADKRMHKIQLNPELKARYRYADHSFKTKTEASPLQSADILANLTFRTFRDQIETRNENYFHPVLISLIEGERHFLQPMDDAEIKKIIDQSPV